MTWKLGLYRVLSGFGLDEEVEAKVVSKGVPRLEVVQGYLRHLRLTKGGVRNGGVLEPTSSQNPKARTLTSQP